MLGNEKIGMCSRRLGWLDKQSVAEDLLIKRYTDVAIDFS